MFASQSAKKVHSTFFGLLGIDFSLLRKNLSGRGEIGRRDSLRSYWGNPWGSKSLRPHFRSLVAFIEFVEFAALGSERPVFNSCLPLADRGVVSIIVAVKYRKGCGGRISPRIWGDSEPAFFNCGRRAP